MIRNKKNYPVVSELFIRGRKLNILLAVIAQSYLKVPKDVRLNSTHYFIVKIPNKRELQQIAINHSSDIGFKDFIKIYEKCTAQKYSFWLTIQLYHQIIFYVLEKIFWLDI